MSSEGLQPLGRYVPQLYQWQWYSTRGVQTPTLLNTDAWASITTNYQVSVEVLGWQGSSFYVGESNPTVAAWASETLGLGGLSGIGEWQTLSLAPLDASLWLDAAVVDKTLNTHTTLNLARLSDLYNSDLSFISTASSLDASLLSRPIQVSSAYDARVASTETSANQWTLFFSQFSAGDTFRLQGSSTLYRFVGSGPLVIMAADGSVSLQNDWAVDGTLLNGLEVVSLYIETSTALNDYGDATLDIATLAAAINSQTGLNSASLNVSLPRSEAESISTTAESVPFATTPSPLASPRSQTQASPPASSTFQASPLPPASTPTKSPTSPQSPSRQESAPLPASVFDSGQIASNNRIESSPPFTLRIRLDERLVPARILAEYPIDPLALDTEGSSLAFGSVGEGGISSDLLSQQQAQNPAGVLASKARWWRRQFSESRNPSGES